MDILDQLRVMNNKGLDLLYGRNFFHIIKTDGNDGPKVHDFLQHIYRLDKTMTGGLMW